MPKKLIALLAVAAAVALAARKSFADQQAERELWAEATDDLRANDWR